MSGSCTLRRGEGTSLIESGLSAAKNTSSFQSTTGMVYGLGILWRIRALLSLRSRRFQGTRTEAPEALDLA